jgi:hypothetical protein
MNDQINSNLKNLIDLKEVSTNTVQYINHYLNHRYYISSPILYFYNIYFIHLFIIIHYFLL